MKGEVRHTHFSASTLELRGDGRTVFGLVAPYGEQSAPVLIDGARMPEVFSVGAFAKSIRERGRKAKLNVRHDEERVVGLPVELRDTPSGVSGAFHLVDSYDADEALDEVRQGILDSFSVEFVSVRDRVAAGVRHVTEAALIAVALVSAPAYATADLVGVRAVTTTNATDVRWLPSDVAQYRRRLLELERVGLPLAVARWRLQVHEKERG